MFDLLQRRARSGWYAVAPILALAGCHPRDAEPPRGTASPAASFAPQPIATELAGLHNVIRAAPGIYSGSEPHGAEAFASLKALGVKTVVSVDGARPEVALARQHSLRYVHVPIGYDGIAAAAGERLAAVVRTAQGPIYIHCHHGKHRGPAAAAAACIAAGETDAAGARRLLEIAGTGAEYAGLWRDVAAYRPPPPDAPLPALVETAEVASLAAAMAQADRHFDNLKLCRDAGWKAPPGHPDLDPRQEALLVKEALHEANRGLADGYDDQFRAWLKVAERLAGQIEIALTTSNNAALTEWMPALERSCRTCHEQYRN